jgi:5'-nucleotidase
MPRPVILVSNDDGVHADGIRALAAALEPLGRVYTVAPETEQSATSHAITLSRPLRLRQLDERCFAVDGTPVDSVYVALHHRDLLPERPAVVVSGINHGLNLGSDVFYSGTVAAAREGALRGVPAIAVSLARGGDRALAGRIAHDLVAALLARRRARGTRSVLLNVNVPPGPVRGLRTTRLGPRLYDEIVEMRTDPRGQQYLWIGGPNVSHPPSRGTDTAAYEAGYASVTPLSIDLTHEKQFDLARALAGEVAVAAPASARRAPGPAARNGGTTSSAAHRRTTRG